MAKVKCLVDCPSDATSKLLLLDEKLEPGSVNGLPVELQTKIQEKRFEITSHRFEVKYGQLSADEVLRVSWSIEL